MVPTIKEVVVPDVQSAHNEATKLASAGAHGDIKALVQSIEYVDDVQTEPLDL